MGLFLLVRARLLPSYRILYSNNQICEMVNLCIYCCSVAGSGIVLESSSYEIQKRVGVDSLKQSIGNNGFCVAKTK